MTTSSTSPYKPRLKSLPIKEQPISRIYDFGVGSVSLTELLAAVAGGSRQLELAERLLVTTAPSLPCSKLQRSNWSSSQASGTPRLPG